MSNRFAFINDAFIPQEKASLPIQDLSMQRGYGIFDFFRTVNHHPLFLDEHLERFYYSAEQMRLAVPYEKEPLKEIIAILLHKNNISASGIRMLLTGGCAPDGFTITTPNFIITQQLLLPPGKPSIKLTTYSHQRQLPHIKTIDYLMAIWLQPFLQQRGADDVLYYHNGVISECPRANFFVVTQNQKLLTPAHNILKGITRSKVMQWAQQIVNLEERDVTLADLKESAEAFITSTTKGVLPVISIDEVTFNKGNAGPVTLWLQQQLAATEKSYCPGT
ncbi:MAG: aminotransferase class IV [Flavisolibacter sp.]|nr:aminotransferase class IV [Flavisolibacter sp.]